MAPAAWSPFSSSLLAAAGCRRERPPSDIFYNGKIVTVDPHFRIVEAMAIRDGRIVAVGTNDDIKTIGRLEDEAGRFQREDATARVGSTPTCMHRAPPIYEFDQRIPDMESIEDVLAFVRARAGTIDAGRPDHFVPGFHHATPRAALSKPCGARPVPRRAILLPSAPGRTPLSTRWRSR